MSRIGNKPVALPAGVTLEVGEKIITVKGPKGTLEVIHNSGIEVEVNGAQVDFKRENDKKQSKPNHGTLRANVHNAVVGVYEGFKKTLVLNGIGYKAQVSNNVLTLWAGYSHTIEIKPEEGVTVSLPTATEILVEGPDKQKVGQTAARIREVRPPEPYLGKGIRYKGEVIVLKEGKRAAAGGKK